MILSALSLQPMFLRPMFLRCHAAGRVSAFAFTCFLAFSTVGLAMAMVAPAAADWPAFLGWPDRDRSASHQPPLTWSAEEAIAWKSTLPGHGQSSPVIIGDAIYVVAVEGPMKEKNLVLRYDLKTGEQVWQREFTSSLQVKNEYLTSRAAPTPLADPDGVIAFFESGNLVALDGDGNPRWQRDFIADYGKYEGRFGLGGSPAQNGDTVFVLADDESIAYLVAINKTDGKTAWKVDREPRTSWSSPILMNLHGTEQIVVSSSGSVDGYDATTGKQLWTFDEVGGNTVASPYPVGQDSFLIGASPGRNGEDSEGAKQSNLLMRINSNEDGFSTEVVWRNEQATSSFGSPIAYEGIAYYTNRSGVLYAIDLVTGEDIYTQRVGHSNWATPVGIGDRVYIFGKSGEGTVIKTGREYEVLAENRLWDAPAESSARRGPPGADAGEILYGFAATPNGFIVRTGSELIAIQ